MLNVLMCVCAVLCCDVMTVADRGVCDGIIISIIIIIIYLVVLYRLTMLTKLPSRHESSGPPSTSDTAHFHHIFRMIQQHIPGTGLYIQSSRMLSIDFVG